MGIGITNGVFGSITSKPGGGGGGGITEITSTGDTVTITDPTGPSTNLEVSGGGATPGFYAPVVVVSAYSGEVTTTPPSGAATIDGFAVVTGDRVLLTAQNQAPISEAKDNGIWIVNTSGDWTRPADWASGSHIPDSSLICVGQVAGANLFSSIWQTSGDMIVDTNGGNGITSILLPSFVSFSPPIAPDPVGASIFFVIDPNNGFQMSGGGPTNLVIIDELPTADPHVAGQLWVGVGNVVMQSAG